eukprot:CAMPEP_0198289148 /NCGR_PEP_ID=MMETSP1449-20131203/7452_1 /TAXON_ID=420275 /ORGANISM="Attheya septentrionalis, Strain CCMP2084" /LENGTH=58 /DNA_ID=CAMNT_0043987443 /DNA_START=163 /DNA_END=339 /DNA_ORIENTATION=-
MVDSGTVIEYGINTVKIIFAVSPLLVLFYILVSAFESDESENLKRKKKTDFELDGHAE